MERLVEVQHLLGQRTRLRAAFHEQHLLITLDTRRNQPLWARIFKGPLIKMQHFEIQDASRPVEEMDLVRQFESELAAIRALVKTLKINMETRV